MCEPVIPDGLAGAAAAGGRGFQSVMYSSDICTGDANKVRNAIESFPSGHSQIAFAGFLYLAIYLNAHLRVFCSSSASSITTPTSTSTAPRRPRHWKLLAVVAPILLATYLASTLVLGHHHHAYDVIFGGLIGSLMAIGSYKMVFVSLADGRTNAVTWSRWREGEVGADGSSTDVGLEVLPTSRPVGGSGV